MRGMVVGEGGRSSGVLLYSADEVGPTSRVETDREFYAYVYGCEGRF